MLLHNCCDYHPRQGKLFDEVELGLSAQDTLVFKLKMVGLIPNQSDSANIAESRQAQRRVLTFGDTSNGRPFFIFLPLGCLGFIE